MERFANGHAPAFGRDSQRYKSAYPFGAICPAEGTGAALVRPRADTRAMQAHLKEISRTLTPGAHAVLLLDRAGWHTTSKLSIPNNVSLVFLPPRSPDLRTKWTRSGNPRENVWPYLRQTHLSNRGNLSGDPQRRLRDLQPPFGRTLQDHVPRTAPPGLHSSPSMTAGIM